MVGPYSPLLALLRTIPGVDQRTAEVILAEMGPTWAASHQRDTGQLGGLCQATTNRPASTLREDPQGSKWPRTALVQAANAAARAKGTDLAARRPGSRADVGTTRPSWRSRTRSW